jgi:integrase
VTVYLPPDCRTWRYRFYFKGEPYSGSTKQSTEERARIWERAYRQRLQREREERELRRAAGLDVFDPADSPSITEWAAVYRAHVLELAAQGKLTRPDRVEDLLRVVLRFWGAKPPASNKKNPPREGEPYHDLRLIDPIRDPDWIVQFEEWMKRRGVAGQTRDQYRSTLSQMYKLAHQPAWRKHTGVQANPFLGIYRDGSRTRDVTIAPDDLRRLLEHASYHVRLAVAIGALAPKLRLANILALRWSVHLDPDLRFITVAQHKTVTKSRRPLVVPISDQLRTILLDARTRAPRPRRPDEDFVVTYRGRQVSEIRGGLKHAAIDADVPYGRFIENGLTFHTLRHTAATILAELDVAEGKRKSVMGHTRLETTQRYTHLRPIHERAPLELLSAELPLTDVVTQAWTRATRGPASRPVKPRSGNREKPQQMNATATPRQTRASARNR